MMTEGCKVRGSNWNVWGEIGKWGGGNINVRGTIEKYGEQLKSWGLV